MNLSKAVDTVNHSLLLVKLDVYGFSSNSLKSMQNYLKIPKNQKHELFSDWTRILVVFPQS